MFATRQGQDQHDFNWNISNTWNMDFKLTLYFSILISFVVEFKHDYSMVYFDSAQKRSVDIISTQPYITPIMIWK